MKTSCWLALLLCMTACAHRDERPDPGAAVVANEPGTPPAGAGEPEPLTRPIVDGSGPEPPDGCVEEDYGEAMAQSTLFNAWSLAHTLRARGLEGAPLPRRTFEYSELNPRPREAGELLKHEGRSYLVLGIEWDSSETDPPPGPQPSVDQGPKLLVAKDKSTGSLVVVEPRRIDRCDRTARVAICNPARGVLPPGPGPRISATVTSVEVPAAPSERLLLEYPGSEISGARYIRDHSCPPAP